MSIAVLGSGVIGLTTAITLRERGYDANIYTISKESDYLPSHAACALWMPFLMCDQILNEAQETDSKYWAEVSWAKFEQVFQLREETGIFKVTHEEFWRFRPALPYYKDIVEDFKEESVDFFQYKHKWQMVTFVVDMSYYMKWLKDKFLSIKGNITVINKFESLDDSSEISEKVIFNCTGLGAQSLFGDNEMQPIKGHLLLFKKNQESYSFGDDEYCIIPRKNSLVIGSLLLNNSDLGINDNDINYLIEKTKILIDSGLDKKYGAHDTINQEYEIITGVRPYRKKGVRIERSTIDNHSVYHNYGHGGSGVTFSWGCAIDCITQFEKNAKNQLSVVNPQRTNDVVDVSIEISHVELNNCTGQLEGVAFEIINRSTRIVRSLKTMLRKNNCTFNITVLIDDKKYTKSNGRIREEVLEKVLDRLKQEGIDYLVFESELEAYANDLKNLVHKKYRRKFDTYRNHSSLGCIEDIMIWYALRLGIIQHKNTLLKASSKYILHQKPPFTANRLISVLPSGLKNVERDAEQRLSLSFGNEVSALCGKIYFDLEGFGY